MNKAVLLLGEPTISVLAEMQLDQEGVMEMADWVKEHRPDCTPPEGYEDPIELTPHDLRDIPWDSERPKNELNTAFAHDYHNTRFLTDNEVLCELAGRKCYDSFAEKAGKKTNKEYFEHIFSMDPVHASILYHAKVTFFFAGVSRKFSHQFIRNYVGSDRDEEGSPSQESTRFTHHYGYYICPPLIAESVDNSSNFHERCEDNYRDYLATIAELQAEYPEAKRKEIYEAAAGVLNMSAETSFVWTTNVMALRKFLKERCHPAADAEIQRFAKKLARISFERWPNLFLGKDLAGVREELERPPVEVGPM